MAINVPMPDLPGNSLLKGIDTGSTLWSRIMQPAIERERMQQQQQQFMQNLALQKQAAARTAALQPYLIQQYQDAHRSAASEAEFKELYRNLIKNAINPETGAPNPQANPVMPPQAGGQQGGVAPPPMPAPMGGMPPGVGGIPPGVNPVAPSMPPSAMADMSNTQEHELRPGNPRLVKLDSLAGLVPGIPKPVQKFSNGMVMTTYPSGRTTVQKIPGTAGQTASERAVNAKEASKIRDQASALINSANLVNQGYALLDNNRDLTGIGSGLAEKFNLSNNPELGKFTTVTGKLQAELGKYASSRGGIQAVKWAQSVKPSSFKPEDYNYGMFEGIQSNLADDYATLNNQYKAVTGQDLPVPLPQMRRNEGANKPPHAGNKVTKKWKLVNGELV